MRREFFFFLHAAIQTEVVNKTLSFSDSDFSICINFTINDDNIALQTPQEYNLLLSPEDPQLQVERNSTRIIIKDDDGTKYYTQFS